MADERYLGDGLYASLDEAGQIKLRAPRVGIDHEVYLEPDVFLELLRFADRIGWGELVNRIKRVV